MKMAALKRRLAGEALVSATFEEANDQTLLTLHQLYPSKELLDGAVASGMVDGMCETLDQFDVLVASGVEETS
jgi:hypothetical protein